MVQSKQDRLNQIEDEITSLINERSKINEELLAERREKNLARVRDWKVKDDSCLILFAKNPNGYHWSMIAKTIKVKEIDFEYSVRVEERRIPFSTLEDLEKEFNIYFVDEVQLTLLQQHFCSLKLDYKNYREYEDTFAKNAEMSIKIPLK